MGPQQNSGITAFGINVLLSSNLITFSLMVLDEGKAEAENRLVDQ